MLLLLLIWSTPLKHRDSVSLQAGAKVAHHKVGSYGGVEHETDPFVVCGHI